MNKKASFLIIGAGIFLSLFIIVSAQSSEDITYPIPELGNCKDEVSCRAYCDVATHMEECLDFGLEHGLVSGKEAEMVRKTGQMSGPGGCKNQGECEQYCDNVSHIDECLVFAEQNGFMEAKEIEEAKKISKMLKEGVRQPGGCKSKKECDSYCSKSENTLECIEFGEKAGLIPQNELEEVKKVKQAIQAGAVPPPCRGKGECDEYCSKPGNMLQCMDFAEKAGLMSGQELEEMKKMRRALEAGAVPPACRGKEECDTYCSQPEHTEECVNFAEAAGFMSKEEAEMARKTGGKGPGDCKSKEECEAFCNSPENQEACFEFAKEHDLIPPEDLERMKEGMGQMRMGLEQAPPEVRGCLKGKVSEEVLSKVEKGEKMPNPKLGNQMRQCFEQFESQMGEKMKEGIENAPAEVKSCLQTLVGPEVLSKVEAGEPPSPELGDRMRTCFEQFKPEVRNEMQEGGFAPGTGPNQPGDFFSNMPQEVRGCVESSLGSDVVEQMKSGQPPKEDIGYKIDQCFRKQGAFPQEQKQMGPQEIREGEMKPPEGEMMPPSEGMMPPREFQEGVQFKPLEQMMPKEGEQMFKPMMPGSSEIMPSQPGEIQMVPPQENQMMAPQEQMAPMPPEGPMPIFEPAPVPEFSPPPAEPAPAPEPVPTSFKANSLFGAIIQYFFGVR